MIESGGAIRPPIEAGNMPAFEQAVTGWKRGNLATAEGVLEFFIPYTVAILGNFLFIGVCLLVSCAADAVVLAAGRDVEWCRRVSLASATLFLIVSSSCSIRQTHSGFNICFRGRVPSLVEKRSGAFLRLVKCTTSAPPCRAATGGTRHGQRYQGRSAGAGA